MFAVLPTKQNQRLQEFTPSAAISYLAISPNRFLSPLSPLFVSDTTTDQIYIHIILHRLKFIGMDVTLVNAQSMLGPGTKNQAL